MASGKWPVFVPQAELRHGKQVASGRGSAGTQRACERGSGSSAATPGGATAFWRPCVAKQEASCCAARYNEANTGGTAASLSYNTWKEHELRIGRHFGKLSTGKAVALRAMAHAEGHRPSRVYK